MISGDDLVGWWIPVQNKAIQASINVHDVVERRSCIDNVHVRRRKRTKEMQKEHIYKNQVPKTKEDISN